MQCPIGNNYNGMKEGNNFTIETNGMTAKQTFKFKIDNEALAEEFFDGSRLLGIVAPVKDYQFSWKLNQLLGFKFWLNHDIEIQLTKKERKHFFSIYEYAVPSSSL